MSKVYAILLLMVGGCATYVESNPYAAHHYGEHNQPMKYYHFKKDF